MDAAPAIIPWPPNSGADTGGSRSGEIVDPTPLLARDRSGGGDGDRSPGLIRMWGLRGAARFLRRAGGRRVLREPSMRVREAAAEQLEERQNDWAYSWPVVVLDILWNLSFIAVAAAILMVSGSESPEAPLKIWIAGYALQCLLHIVCVCLQYQRRLLDFGRGTISGDRRENAEGGRYFEGQQNGEERTSFVKHLESANTMLSFIWWILGFYWVSASQNLARDAPHLYWLCIVFLAFDVFFVVFCVAVACIIGIAVCCCLPCIIAILYAVADQEGATEEDVKQLPKYKFQSYGHVEKVDSEMSGRFGGVMTKCGTDTPQEHVLSAEDAECCICLSAYEDGAELRELPCGHHFHCPCIDKWLFINATCPLCKYSILKSNSSSEVV